MELIDYVTNTPQNTNRTILKQLVNSEKNKAVYESVEELKRDGGVGYTESKKTVLTFDGNTESKPSFMECYQISDEVIDVNTITRIFATSRDNGETVDIFELMNDMGFDLTVQENDDSAILKFEVSSTVTFVVLIIFADTDFYGDLLPKGTYVLSNDSMYISYMEVETETIHPIKDNYLPMDAIAEATTEKLAKSGQIGRILRKERFVDEEVRDSIDFSDTYPGLQMIGSPFTDSVTQYPTKAVFVIDGVRHECEKRTKIQDELESSYYGNLALGFFAGGETPPEDYNTGEPFLFMKYTRGFLGYIVDPNLAPQHTIAFYEVEETIIPIDPKYLPGVCLPVVELTPENLDDPSWNYLTKAENDKLNEISKTHLAFLAKVNLKVPETFLMLRKWSSGAEIPVYNGSNPFAGGSVHGYTSVQLLGDDPNEWVMCVYDNRVT